MIPPGLVILRVGRVRWPLPLFLLWPVAGALWLGLWLVALATLRTPHRLRAFHGPLAALTFFRHARGLLVDVQPHDGPRLYLRLV